MRIVTLSIMAVFLLFSANALAAASMGPEEIVLSGGKSGPVTLEHRMHQDTLATCTPCHSQFPQEIGIIDKMKTEKTLKKKFVMNKVCLSCHRDDRKAGKDHGPTSCKGCHVKP